MPVAHCGVIAAVQAARRLIPLLDRVLVRTIRLTTRGPLSALRHLENDIMFSFSLIGEAP